MRNLKSVSCTQTPLLPCTTSFAVDEHEGHVYHASLKGQLTCTQLSSGKHVWHVHLAEDTDTGVVDVSLVEDRVTFLATCMVGALQGNTTCTSPVNRQVDEVGCVPEGVLAAAWNPSADVLAMLTATKRLVVLGLAWDVLADIELAQGNHTVVDDAPPLFGSCGITWRGDGQYMAVSYVSGNPDQPCALVMLDCNEFVITAHGTDIQCNTGAVAWQPNGRNLYAAQAIGDSTSPLRPEWVRAQQGITGPDASGITPAAYPESNSAITNGSNTTPVAEIRSDSMEATFTTHSAVGIFETNGLPHGGFWADHWDIAQNKHSHSSHILAMQWSPDSELLALVVQHGSAQKAAVSYGTQVWRRSNWHWYLLREEQQGGNCVPMMSWGQGSPLQLFCCSNDVLHQTVFAYDTDVSALGTVALVDGAAVNITPMRATIIPPPLAAARLTFDHPVQLLAWSPPVGDGCPPDQEALAVVLSSGAVCVAHTPSGTSWADMVEQNMAECAPGPDHVGCWQAPVRHACYAIDMRTTTVQHMCFMDSTTLLLCTITHDTKACNVWQMVALHIKPAVWNSHPNVVLTPSVIDRVVVTPIPGPVRHLVTPALASAHAAWLVMADDCSLQLFDIVTHQCFPAASASLAARPYQLVRAMADGLLIGLTAAGELHVGGRVVTQDCTSFLVAEGKSATGPLVLWTTRDQRLFVQTPAMLQQGHHVDRGASIHSVLQPDKAGIMQDAMRPTGAAVQSTLSERAIEQASMLLAAPPGCNTLIFHLPRGNLETVQPRAFVLPAIAEALACHAYATAWRLVVVNRVDVNIMVDYQWPLVLQHADQLVEGIRTASDMCDLLQGLQDANVLDPSCGMYRELSYLLAPHLQEEQQGNASMSGKVARVCSALRAAMQARADAHCWFVAILTTHVVEANLGAALQCVADQRHAELCSATQQGIAEQGIRHMLTYVDAETLYRAALGVYELEVAYLVVSCSSKDPAEHLLQLQEFRNAGPSEHRIKYAIDVYLERWDSALHHLLAADDFDAALALARTRQLLKQLLAACPHGSPRRAIVLKAHAQALHAQHRLQDAAMAYVAAGCLEDAVHAYHAAGCWQQALSLGCRLHERPGNALPSSVVRMAADTAADLAAMHRFAEAAQVLLEYCDDTDGGVQLLCQGLQWREAVRQAWRCARDDLLETVVHPAAAARASVMIQDARDALARSDKYLNRWRAVRSKRQAMQDWQGAQRVDDNAVLLEDDALSIASSVVSGMSAYTSATHATTAATSTAAPSTVGGRPVDSKGKKKKKDKQHKIRQGSEEEEGQLHALLLAMGPSDMLLQECSELLELLIGSGHEEDALMLQGCMAAWVEHFELIHPEVQASPPPTQGRNSDNAARGVAWKWDMLRITNVN